MAGTWLTILLVSLCFHSKTAFVAHQLTNAATTTANPTTTLRSTTHKPPDTVTSPSYQTSHKNVSTNNGSGALMGVSSVISTSNTSTNNGSSSAGSSGTTNKSPVTTAATTLPKTPQARIATSPLSSSSSPSTTTTTNIKQSRKPTSATNKQSGISNKNGKITPSSTQLMTTQSGFTKTRTTMKPNSKQSTTIGLSSDTGPSTLVTTYQISSLSNTHTFTPSGQAISTTTGDDNVSSSGVADQITTLNTGVHMTSDSVITTRTPASLANKISPKALAVSTTFGEETTAQTGNNPSVSEASKASYDKELVIIFGSMLGLMLLTTVVFVIYYKCRRSNQKKFREGGGDITITESQF